MHHKGAARLRQQRDGGSQVRRRRLPKVVDARPAAGAGGELEGGKLGGKAAMQLGRNVMRVCV